MCGWGWRVEGQGIGKESLFFSLSFVYFFSRSLFSYNVFFVRTPVTISTKTAGALPDSISEMIEASCREPGDNKN